MPTCILGFAGEISSGKGTATELVKSWYPKTPSFRFSDPLRMFYRLFLLHFPVLQKGGEPTFHSSALMRLAHILGESFGVDLGVTGARYVQLHEFVYWLAGRFVPLHKGVWPSEASTADLQAISTAVRSFFGEDVLERAILGGVRNSNSTSPIAIIEGIRRLVDIGTLMKDTSTMFRLTYVEADPMVRYERFIRRNEKPGDEYLSLEQFGALGQAEAEMQIRALRPHAHLVIDNSGSQGHLEAVLSNTVGAWLKG